MCGELFLTTNDQSDPGLAGLIEKCRIDDDVVYMRRKGLLWIAPSFFILEWCDRGTDTHIGRHGRLDEENVT